MLVPPRITHAVKILTIRCLHALHVFVQLKHVSRPERAKCLNLGLAAVLTQRNGPFIQFCARKFVLVDVANETHATP